MSRRLSQRNQPPAAGYARSKALVLDLGRAVDLPGGTATLHAATIASAIIETRRVTPGAMTTETAVEAAEAMTIVIGIRMRVCAA